MFIDTFTRTQAVIFLILACCLAGGCMDTRVSTKTVRSTMLVYAVAGETMAIEMEDSYKLKHPTEPQNHDTVVTGKRLIAYNVNKKSAPSVTWSRDLDKNFDYKVIGKLGEVVCAIKENKVASSLLYISLKDGGIVSEQFLKLDQVENVDFTHCVLMTSKNILLSKHGRLYVVNFHGTNITPLGKTPGDSVICADELTAGPIIAVAEHSASDRVIVHKLSRIDVDSTMYIPPSNATVIGVICNGNKSYCISARKTSDEVSFALLDDAGAVVESVNVKCKELIGESLGCYLEKENNGITHAMIFRRGRHSLDGIIIPYVQLRINGGSISVSDSNLELK